MRYFLFVISGLFVSFVYLCALDQGEAWAKFSVTPKLDLQIEYNDNIFLTKNDEVDDLLTIITPSLSLLLEKQSIQMDLNYGLEFTKYREETYLDRDKIEDIHRGSLDGIIFPERKASILYEGSIDRVAVDDRRPDVDENNIVNVTTQYHGLLRPRYQYRLTPKVTGEIAYQYETSLYDDDDNRDLVENESDDIVDQDVALLVEMKYSERLDLLVDTKYNWHDSDTFDDYEVLTGLAGFVWQPKEHLSLDVKAGGAITYLDNDDEDLTDSLFKVLLKYAPPEKTGFFASYTKDFTFSTDDGRYRWWEAAGGVSYEGRLAGRFKAFTRENTYQFVDRKEEAYGGNLDLTYDLNSKMSTEFLAGYAFRTYRPVKEEAHRYTLSCSLTYALKQSAITLRYAANINDSDIQFNDYKNNIVSINYSVQF